MRFLETHRNDAWNLLPHSVKVLDLETLIALKEELKDEKDRAMLPILRRTLEESRRNHR